MPTKKVRVANEEREETRALLSGIAARKVMPACSSCSRAKVDCLLRAGHGVCTRCTAEGSKCDLYLTRKDGGFEGFQF